MMVDGLLEGVAAGLERLISSADDRKLYGQNAVISSEKFSADKMANCNNVFFRNPHEEPSYTVNS